MSNKLLHTTGKSDIKILEWEKPDITDTQIEIKTVFCGICRSDIAAYKGWEDFMPFGMQGHEGLGVVTKIGNSIQDVKVGDFVATISDPAYCETYNAEEYQYIKVPELDPKYIIQPTACAMNIIYKTLANSKQGDNILLIGTGFMSVIIGQYLQSKGVSIDVYGSSHKDIWDNLGHNLMQREQLGRYDIVIDLSSKEENFYLAPDILNDEGLLCYAATPFTEVKTNFFDLCWKCVTIIMPSPRNSDFKKVMKQTVELIDSGDIDPSILWTKGYDAFTEYVEAFEEGVNRTKNYIRGYFFYDKNL